MIKWKFGNQLMTMNGLYEVSNLGNIKSLIKPHIKSEKILKPFKNENGYEIITLTKNKETKSYRVHRLVALAFLENEENYPCINHKDENRSNNNVDNLEWCTYSYNNNYGNRISKYCKKRYKKVNQYRLNGEFIKEWDSIKQISEKLKISSSGVIACCKNRFKQFKGYIWKYKLEEN
jgi:hypothetical protein